MSSSACCFSSRVCDLSSMFCCRCASGACSVLFEPCFASFFHALVAAVRRAVAKRFNEIRSPPHSINLNTKPLHNHLPPQASERVLVLRQFFPRFRRVFTFGFPPEQQRKVQ
jgi:hypothetical protein